MMLKMECDVNEYKSNDLLSDEHGMRERKRWGEVQKKNYIQLVIP